MHSLHKIYFCQIQRSKIPVDNFDSCNELFDEWLRFCNAFEKYTNADLKISVHNEMFGS